MSIFSDDVLSSMKISSQTFQYQAFQADFTAKLQDIKTSIIDLQATNQFTTNQVTIIESVNQLATIIITAKSAAKSAIKSTTKSTTKSYAEIVIQDSQQSQRLIA